MIFIYLQQQSNNSLKNKKHYNKTLIPSCRIIADRTNHQQSNKNNLTTNGSPTGARNILIEPYFCEIDEVSKVKHYELNKISICKIKAFAVENTITEGVHRCSQETDYIRASRKSYYYLDATRSNVLDPAEVRNELAGIKILKNTPYKPKNYQHFI